MTDWISSHRRWVAALAVVAIVAIAATAASRGSDPADARVAPGPSAPAADGAGGEPSGGSTGAEDTTTTVATDPNPQLATGTPSMEVDLPLEVTVTPGAVDASGLSTVKVHIVADAGSQIYGAEARICPIDASVVQDADFRPTQTGRCVLNPLRAGADAHLEVAGAPPYERLDLSFRTGSGSDTYTTQSGDHVTVVCDADHPCSLVLKLQVPNAFGFRSYPIPFS